MGKEVAHVEYEGKAWGRTACIVRHVGFTVHHLVIDPETRCSRHHHEHRCNGFFVISGSMLVEEFKNGILVKSTELSAGDYYEVEPRVEHRFKAFARCEALEVYFPPDVREDDIVRADVGGSV